MDGVDLGLHPKQAVALNSRATEVLYGGAAGGGKSHLMRVAAIYWASCVPGLQIYIFRRLSADLTRNHMTGLTGFPQMLAAWEKQGWVNINYSQNVIKFWNGSEIHLAHCQYDRDVTGFQGADIHVLMIDELTHFSEFVYKYLRTRVREANIVPPEGWKGLFPRILCGANPGGIGHNWVKKMFVDFTVNGRKEKYAEDSGLIRAYHRARLEDNPSLDKNYSKRLEGAGSASLVRALREGDWNIASGGIFETVWDESVHIIKPFDVPEGWKIDRSFDWGKTAPFSVGWWGESNGEEFETEDGDLLWYPKGSVIRIQEWYGWNGNDNQGCGLLTEEIAAGILEREAEWGWEDRVVPGPADNQIFVGMDGNNMAKNMANMGVHWLRSNKGKGSRVHGWEIMGRMFREAKKDHPEEPVLLATEHCIHFARTVPTLPSHETIDGDVATDAEDHVGDETRYRLFKAHKQNRTGLGAKIIERKDFNSIPEKRVKRLGGRVMGSRV